MNIHTPVKSFIRLGKEQEAGLRRLNILTLHDMLFYFPTRYADEHEESGIAHGKKGDAISIYGVLEKVKVRRSFKGHIPLTEASVFDNSGSVRLIWFNQPYIGKMYGEGARVKIMGTLSEDKKGLFLSNPHIEKAPLITPHLENSLFKETDGEKSEETFLIPIYKETSGISSNFLYHLVKKIGETGVLQELVDPVPLHIREELSLPGLKEALLYIHFPKKKELTIAARKRFAFQEIFLMKLLAEKEKAALKHSPAYSVIADEHVASFLSAAPFPPTNAQSTAITTILADMAKNEPMGRLLEGDVGSGKTFVAATALYAAIMSKHSETKMPLQVAYMAPTEILAKQHFDSFCEYFAHTNLSIGLLTSSVCKKFPSKTKQDEGVNISKRQLLTWIEGGSISLVVGTHALIQKSVLFHHLSLVIIDEQHRFGVKQRKKLANKGGDGAPGLAKLPHLLSMSATPIPRTLALTLFGDLDLSVLDELPKGRKPIETKLLKTNADREALYAHIRKEVKDGRQVYVICPRIEKGDEENKASNLRSVEEEADYLAHTVFPELIVDTLHGKMKADEKEEVMRDFLEKKSDILVATSVIEVGVNVPNASIIVIEGADRFGLAQLHQLRGRVGRGSHASYCYLVSGSESEKTEKRLSALVKAKNGFELAEIDMQERGIGALTMGKQWGVSDIAMEALKNPKLVELAGTHAKRLIQKDENLSEYPDLALLLEEREKVHME